MSAVNRWILSDLLAHALLHVAGARQATRILVAVELKPGCQGRALRLLGAGPPFDPGNTALALHDVFVLDDEALFLVGTRGENAIEPTADVDFWAAVASWREVMTGRVRVAEHAYAWSREGSTAPRERHLGLGL